MASSERSALPRSRKRAGRRVLRGMGCGQEGGVEKSDRRCALGRRAAEADRPVTTQFKRTTGRACSRGAVLILIAASFGWTAAAQPKFQKLTGAQIHATFGGMELSDEVHWYDLFEKNGTLQSSSMGHKRTGSGGPKGISFVSTIANRQVLRGASIRKECAVTRRIPLSSGCRPSTAYRPQVRCGNRHTA
jgi:hypothetical protein